LQRETLVFLGYIRLGKVAFGKFAWVKSQGTGYIVHTVLLGVF